MKTIGEERATAKAQRPVKKYGDVDHQHKNARVVGIQVHVEKIGVDTIQTQIRNLQEDTDVYKSIHGEQGYNDLLVRLINKMTGLYKNAGTLLSSVAASSYDLTFFLLEEDKGE